MYGSPMYIEELKQVIFDAVNHRSLLKRLTENTMYSKKGVGVLGQLLPEIHGPYAGHLNLKETAFLPYVIAVRLLALKYNSNETSTLTRLQKLPDSALSQHEKALYSHMFTRLLEIRL